jgi:NosR/NirI family transcriptional regulator, nitrous oxide reductase regulator
MRFNCNHPGRLKTAVFAAAALSLLAGYGLRTFASGPKPDERAYLKELAPDAHFAAKSGEPPVYLADDGTTAFNTYDITPRIHGYAGPIKVLLAMDRAGKITGLRIVEHRETRNYVYYMETPGYLAQFIGRFAGEPLEVDKDIDGISRATVSVKALARTIRESSRIVALNVLGLQIASGPAPAGIELKWLWYALLFTAAFAAYLFTRRTKRFLPVRDIFLVLSVAVIGFHLSSPFSILHVFNIVLLRPSSASLWYALVICTALSIVVAGRFYCGWLCPFGALSELAGRLPVRKWTVPPEADERGRALKYVLLTAVVVLVFTTGRVDYADFEPYVTLFSFHGNPFAWSLVGVALVMNLRVERFWCRYLCPVAALTGLLSRKAAGYPAGGNCPMGNKPGAHISECIRCNRCRTQTGRMENPPRT